ncbi:MAG: hypothetical protein Q7S02_03330 [bacterium]|nr:hypothetical protein [bacterium]
MRTLKTERRAARRRKTKHAPSGGTVGSQRKLLETRRGYAGSVKIFIRRRTSGK